jgi:chemotaxis signal transduction protein
MSSTGLLLTICTTRHRYIVCRDQILEIRLITRSADLERPDERGHPLVSAELGKLLDPQDLRSNARRHALIIPTRRRGVALLVERVEDFSQQTAGEVQPLAPLLRQRLARPWFMGTVVCDDTPVLVLDLRQIAQDVLFGQRNNADTASCRPT